jgi:cell division protein FtsB
MKTMKYILPTVLIAVAFCFSLDYALQKQAVMDCIKFQEQAKKYQSFWITQDEAIMCTDAQVDISGIAIK